MATENEDWATILTQLRARIIEVTASANPDYSVAGRSLSKGAYLEQLMRQYQEAKHFAQLDAELGDAWAVIGRGVT